MRKQGTTRVLLTVGLLLLAGCAGLIKPMQAPQISVEQVRLHAVEQGVPAFAIGLRIVNPNDQVLHLKGMVYALELAGKRIVQGASNEFAPIAAYGEGRVTLIARADWLQGVRLVAELVQKPLTSLPYRLELQVDPGGWYPRQAVVEEGRIDLSGYRN